MDKKYLTYNEYTRRQKKTIKWLVDQMKQKGLDALDIKMKFLTKKVSELIQQWAQEKEDLDSQFDELKQQLVTQVNQAISSMYMVGTVLTLYTDDDPNDIYEGTWQEIAAGRVLVGAGTLGGDVYTARQTGGAARVTLDVNTIPSHTHGGSTSGAGGHNHYYGADDGGSNPGGTNGLNDTGTGGHNGSAMYCNTVGDHTHGLSISATGGGQAHENRQPYLVVHYWLRTA